jgi:C_GCAxxG_C_C family probable redox protein
MKRSDRAVALFKEGFSCSQAVLSVFAEEYGLSQEQALKISGAFGSGMGRMGHTCGAVTGAFMVIGLKYGRTKADDRASKEKTYALVLEFVERFKRRQKTVMCRGLTGCDLLKPEGRRAYSEKRLQETLCSVLVRDAVEILEEILPKTPQNSK